MMAHVEMGSGAGAGAAPVFKLFGAVINDRPPKEEDDDDDDAPAAAAAAAAPPPPAAGGAAAAEGEGEGEGERGGEGAAPHPPPAAAAAALPCPRCRSRETKFCYFNNYNVNQPRHFCKACRRYWTAGGALRNVPVGAGRRKSRPTPPPPHHHRGVGVEIGPPSDRAEMVALDRWIPRPGSAEPPRFV